MVKPDLYQHKENYNRKLKNVNYKKIPIFRKIYQEFKYELKFI